MQRRHIEKCDENCQELLDSFSSIVFKHIPRNQNQEANRLAQSAFGYRWIVKILVDELIDDRD